MKMVADRHEHAITTSTSDELLSRINIDDFEKPLTSDITSEIRVYY